MESAQEAIGCQGTGLGPCTTTGQAPCPDWDTCTVRYDRVLQLCKITLPDQQGLPADAGDYGRTWRYDWIHPIICHYEPLHPCKCHDCCPGLGLPREKPCADCDLKLEKPPCGY